MIKFTGTKNGRLLIGLGLSDENWKRLKFERGPTYPDSPGRNDSIPSFRYTYHWRRD